MGIDWTEEEEREQKEKRSGPYCGLCKREVPMQIPGVIRLRPGLFLATTDGDGHFVWLCEDCQCDLQEMALKLVEISNPKKEPEEPKIPEVKLT